MMRQIVALLFLATVVGAVCPTTCADITPGMTINGDCTFGFTGTCEVNTSAATPLISLAANTNVDCNGVTLIGNTTGTAFDISDLSNVTLHNCVIKNYTNAISAVNVSGLEIYDITTDSARGYSLASSENVLFENVSISNPNNVRAVHVINSKNISFSNIRISGCRDYGLYLSGVNDSTISEVNASGCTSAGIFLTNSHNNTLRGRVTGEAPQPGASVLSILDDSTKNTIRDVTFDYVGGGFYQFYGLDSRFINVTFGQGGYDLTIKALRFVMQNSSIAKDVSIEGENCTIQNLSVEARLWMADLSGCNISQLNVSGALYVDETCLDCLRMNITDSYVGGKPIYWLVGTANYMVPSDAGMVGVIDASGINISGLSINNAGDVIVVANSTDVDVRNSVIKNGSVVLGALANNTRVLNVSFENASLSIYPSITGDPYGTFNITECRFGSTSADFSIVGYWIYHLYVINTNDSGGMFGGILIETSNATVIGGNLHSVRVGEGHVDIDGSRLSKGVSSESSNISLKAAYIGNTQLTANLTDKEMYAVSTPPAGAPAGMVNISKYVNVTNISEFSGTWTFYIHYSDGDVANVEESTLRCYWYNESSGAWENVTYTEVDTVNNRVLCNTSHFSIFGVFGEPAAVGGVAVAVGVSAAPESFEIVIGLFIAAAAVILARNR